MSSASTLPSWCDVFRPGAPVCVTARHWEEALDRSGSDWKPHIAFTLELALPGMGDNKPVKNIIIVVNVMGPVCTFSYITRYICIPLPFLRLIIVPSPPTRFTRRDAKTY